VEQEWGSGALAEATVLSSLFPASQSATDTTATAITYLAASMTRTRTTRSVPCLCWVAGALAAGLISKNRFSIIPREAPLFKHSLLCSHQPKHTQTPHTTTTTQKGEWSSLSRLMSTSARFWHRLRTAWPFSARSAPETPDTGGLMNNNNGDDDHRETRPLLRTLDAGMKRERRKGGREGGVESRMHAVGR
jgi:hypothetical protein